MVNTNTEYLILPAAAALSVNIFANGLTPMILSADRPTLEHLLTEIENPNPNPIVLSIIDEKEGVREVLLYTRAFPTFIGLCTVSFSYSTTNYFASRSETIPRYTLFNVDRCGVKDVKSYIRSTGDFIKDHLKAIKENSTPTISVGFWGITKVKNEVVWYMSKTTDERNVYGGICTPFNSRIEEAKLNKIKAELISRIKSGKIRLRFPTDDDVIKLKNYYHIENDEDLFDYIVSILANADELIMASILNYTSKYNVDKVTKLLKSKFKS